MLSINTDLTSGILQTTLNRNSEGVNRAIERLTTGYRINKAQDDAAGYAVAEKLSSKIDSMLKVQENAEHGIALLRTAEGGLNGIQDLLQRLRDLAVQASNDVYAEDSRLAMQSEANQLIEEINRIRNSTEFNGLNLFEGPAAEDTGSTGGVTTTSFTSRSRSIGLSNANVRINKIDDSGVNVSGSSNGAEESRGSFLSTLDEEIDSLSSSITSPTTNNAAAQSQPITFTPTPRAADITGAEDFGANETRTITIDGIDYQITNRLNSSQTFSYTKDTTTGEFTIISNNFTVRAQTDVRHNIVVAGRNNVVYGGNFNDTLRTASGAATNTFYGGAGDDTITMVSGGGSYAYGGDGNDTIINNVSGYTLDGGRGDDIITATVGSSTIYGRDGNDTITVTGNSHVIYGNEGDDDITITRGSNVYVNGNEGNNTLTDNGTNTQKVNVPGANIFELSFAGRETITHNINGIDYTITNNSASSNWLNYTIADDGTINFTRALSTNTFTIRGDENAQHNVIISLNGATFYGGNLSDNIQVNAANAIIYAQGGNDTITVSNVYNTTLYGGSGNDTILATTGTRHYINSEAGEDNITVGASHSYVNGGDGDDSVIMNSGGRYSTVYDNSGTNTITDNSAGTMIYGFGSNDNADAVELTVGQTATITVNGKNYYIRNNSTTRPTALLYNYNAVTDETSFSGYGVNVTSERDVAQNVNLYGYNTNFFGSDLDDTINIYTMTGNVYSYGGNDNININFTQNNIWAGDGDDNVVMNSSAAIYGENGNDTITVNAVTGYIINGGNDDDTYNLNYNATSLVD